MSQAPPPPPPGAGAVEGPYSPTDAVAYGWGRFKANPGPLLVGVLILLVLAGGLSVLASMLATAAFVSDPTATIDPETGAISFERSGGFVATILTSVVVSLVVGFLAQVFVAGLMKGALDTVDGRPVSLGAMFTGWDKGKVLVAAIIVSVATALGTLLCYLPGIAVSYLAGYTMFFIVDRDLAPVPAIKASVEFTTGNLGPTLLFWLLSAVVGMVGAILCGVGLLAAIPVVLVGMAYTYRRLQGQPVSPAG